MKTTIYVATADGVLVITGFNGNWRGEVHLDGKQVQCVAAASSYSPRIVYCGTFGDGLFRSDDEGATWRSCDSFGRRKVTALAIDEGQDTGGSSVVYAGTEPSALFRSDNGGETWHELPTLLTLPSASGWSFPPRPETHHVRYILPDSYAPGRLHVAIEAGALLRSEDMDQHGGTAFLVARKILTRLQFTQRRLAGSTRLRGTAILRARTMLIHGAA